MRKIILASHGSLAEGMLSAGKMILQDCPQVRAYGLDTYGSPTDIYEILNTEISTHTDDTYIILCDINGGSVHNQLLHLCVYEHVQLVTGMTLSMLLEIVLDHEHTDTAELLTKVIQSAGQNMLIFNKERVQAEIEKGIEDDKLW